MAGVKGQSVLLVQLVPSGLWVLRGLPVLQVWWLVLKALPVQLGQPALLLVHKVQPDLKALPGQPVQIAP